MSAKSVGVILDGNRRWAKSKDMPGFLGHKKGYEVFKDFLDWAKDFGVETVFAYVFSEENWRRTEEEVSFLIGLIREIVEKDLEDFLKRGFKVKFAGSVEKFPKDIYEKMLDIEERSKNNTNLNLVLCMSYGGRQEIVHAFNRISKKKKEENSADTEITMEDVSKNIYSADFTDPDIIIRTSGEMRLSGFLLWQASYSELFFTKTLWPDFSKQEFASILEEYKSRNRRMGK